MAAGAKALESDVQRRLIKELEERGWMAVKIVLCNMNGFPDIMALKDGRTVFIEVKRAGERPRPLQEFRHRKLREQGFEVYVCNGKLPETL
jgi:archaeal holliday junction resolvase (hjc)